VKLNKIGRKIPSGLFVVIALTLLSWGLFIAICGENPFNVFRLIVTGAFGRTDKIYAVINKIFIFFFASLAYSIPAWSGMYNVGGDGQLTIGAFAAAFIPFSARILRTPPTASTFGISTDPVIFSNGKQLLDYLDEARYGWQFSDDDIDQLLAAYDDDFFLKKVLIVGAIGLSSGSIKVGIEDIIQSDEQLNVLYRFQFPETGTCDMMSWHYFVEISADDASGRTVAKSYLPNIGTPTIVR
jgi:hypothetical protein